MSDFERPRTHGTVLSLVVAWFVIVPIFTAIGVGITLVLVELFISFGAQRSTVEDVSGLIGLPVYIGGLVAILMLEWRWRMGRPLPKRLERLRNRAWSQSRT